MRNTLAIAGKDARVYLTTWTSYILFGCFTFITAGFFLLLVREYQFYYLQSMQSQQAWMLEQMNLTDLVMGNVFRNIEVFFLFFLPILTMRLIAEERKGKTLELLMTAPVRPVEIVIGKYLAALLIMGIMLALTAVFPILLQVYGSTEAGGQSPLDWSTILVGYLGLFMLGAAFIGVGLFASSVTESQIISVILSFALLLGFFIIGYAARGQEGFARELLEYLSLTKHVEVFVKGIINIQAVVYYVSLAFLGLFLTYRVVEAQRWH